VTGSDGRPRVGVDDDQALRHQARVFWTRGRAVGVVMLRPAERRMNVRMASTIAGSGSRSSIP
jgi:hypothetical protein